MVASAVAGDPALAVRAGFAFGLLFILLWLAWRAYVFLALLLAPVREKLKPHVDPVNQHLDATLRRSGLGALADLGNKLQSGLDGAVGATQRGIDARKK